VHVSTETSHHAHVVAIDGVGITEQDREIVEALVKKGEMSTPDVADTLQMDGKMAAYRGLERLEDAGVVKRRQGQSPNGSALAANLWSLTDRAIDSGVSERVRTNSDLPLDPVEERDQRIDELEERVDELEEIVDRIDDRLETVELSSSSTEQTWAGIDPSE
jgi:predicted ArsR family transcriptional regulator